MPTETTQPTDETQVPVYQTVQQDKPTSLVIDEYLESAKDKIAEAGNAIAQAFENLKEGVVETFEVVKESLNAESATDDVQTKEERFYSKITEQEEHQHNRTLRGEEGFQEKLKDIEDATSDKVIESLLWAQEKGEQFKEWLNKDFQPMNDQATPNFQVAPVEQKTIDFLDEKLKEGSHRAQEKAFQTYNQFTEGKSDSAEDEMERAGNRIKQTIQEGLNKTDESAQKVKDWTNENVLYAQKPTVEQKINNNRFGFDQKTSDPKALKQEWMKAEEKFNDRVDNARIPEQQKSQQKEDFYI